MVHNAPMEHSEWITTLYDGAAATTAARRAGIPHTTVTRQLHKGGLDAGIVIALARHYGKDIITALVDTGHLTVDEVSVSSPRLSLPYATNEEIYEELLRRVDPKSARLMRDDFDESGDVISPDFGPWEMPSDAVAQSEEDHPEEDHEFD